MRTSNPPRHTGTINWGEDFSYSVYDELRHHTDGLSDVIAGGQMATDKVSVRIDGPPETADGNMVSGNFFSGLGVQLSRGRGFTAKDEADSASNMVITRVFTLPSGRRQSSSRALASPL